jgi:hypothetical protein
MDPDLPCAGYCYYEPYFEEGLNFLFIWSTISISLLGA